MTTVNPGTTGIAQTPTLLRRTRPLTVTAVVFLALQLFGNLYEQLVGNVSLLAEPRVGGLVGALEPGSPVYYYLPWAPLGVVLVVVLAVRLPRLAAPGWVVRRARLAVAALAVGVAAKALLITRVNPRFRDPTVEVDAVRDWAMAWAVGNGVAILAVSAALVLVLSWRARLVDAVAGCEA